MGFGQLFFVLRLTYSKHASLVSCRKRVSCTFHSFLPKVCFNTGPKDFIEPSHVVSIRWVFKCKKLPSINKFFQILSSNVWVNLVSLELTVFDEKFKSLWNDSVIACSRWQINTDEGKGMRWILHDEADAKKWSKMIFNSFEITLFIFRRRTTTPPCWSSGLSTLVATLYCPKRVNLSLRVLVSSQVSVNITISNSLSKR